MKDSTERFGYEWKKYPKIIPEFEELFLRWVFPLKADDFKNKMVLDAGCGSGRNSYWAFKYGAKEVVAFDYDQDTIVVTRRNLSFPNCRVLYSSIYNINYRDYFDIVFCIGVIHHLEYPRKAIERLVKAAKIGGLVLIWVYGYEGREWIVRYLDPIRKITSRFPLRVVDFFGYFISIPLYIYLNWSNYKQPYQLSKLRFWHLHQIVLDQLIPRIANCWKKEEVWALFENQGLEDIKIYSVNNNSWTITGRKK